MYQTLLKRPEDVLWGRTPIVTGKHVLRQCSAFPNSGRAGIELWALFHPSIPGEPLPLGQTGNFGYPYHELTIRFKLWECLVSFAPPAFRFPAQGISSMQTSRSYIDCKPVLLVIAFVSLNLASRYWPPERQPHVQGDQTLWFTPGSRESG